ncbi:MAG TPA: STAS domain-containing protein [Actinomycetota bacterium]
MTDRVRIERAAPRLVRVSGELDMASSPELAEVLREIAGAGEGSLVLDLSDLSFIDSTGLRVLIDVAVQLGESGDLILRNPTRPVMEVLEIAGVAEAAPNFVVEAD